MKNSHLYKFVSSDGIAYIIFEYEYSSSLRFDEMSCAWITFYDKNLNSEYQFTDYNNQTIYTVPSGKYIISVQPSNLDANRGYTLNGIDVTGNYGKTSLIKLNSSTIYILKKKFIGGPNIE